MRPVDVLFVPSLFIPFLLHVPSGKLSGPTLKPLRCFFGFDASVSSSSGRLKAIFSAVSSIWVDALAPDFCVMYKISDHLQGLPTSCDTSTVAGVIRISPASDE